jgi:putative restriction endonuclease
MDLEIFANLNRALIKGKRAPHKPLLVLLALSQYQSGHQRLLAFNNLQEKLKDLLVEYGPMAKSYKPELPFFHLQNDDVWELVAENPEDQSNIDSWKAPKAGFLKSANIHGGFPQSIYQQLNEDTIARIATTVLESQFPESLHEDILNSVGLDIQITVKRRRDPAFRSEILRAYESKCAICNFRVLMNHKAIGVEAAHIQWHTASGPDHVSNGFALCSLHHKLFDRGIFTVDDHLRVVVSESAIGNQSFDELMVRYHGQEIHRPLRKAYFPKDQYLDWHVSEVFKGPPRYIEEAD